MFTTELKKVYSVLLLVGVTSLSFVACDPGETLNAALNRPEPLGPNAFRAGTHRVGVDINPGRYYSAPEKGCYYERLSGFGGELSDIISNEFIGFDAAQWIVDIEPTDLAFKSDEECGTWTKTPKGSVVNFISPGAWLVPDQVVPGVYRTNAAEGCYWQRLEDFGGRLGSIVANEFISSAGTAYVEIDSTDTGFSSDDDCGTWQKISLSGKRATESRSPHDFGQELLRALEIPQADVNRFDGVFHDDAQAQRNKLVRAKATSR